MLPLYGFLTQVWLYFLVAIALGASKPFVEHLYLSHCLTIPIRYLYVICWYGESVANFSFVCVLHDKTVEKRWHTYDNLWCFVMKTLWNLNSRNSVYISRIYLYTCLFCYKLWSQHMYSKVRLKWTRLKWTSGYKQLILKSHFSMELVHYTFIKNSGYKEHFFHGINKFLISGFYCRHLHFIPMYVIVAGRW